MNAKTIRCVIEASQAVQQAHAACTDDPATRARLWAIGLELRDILIAEARKQERIEVQS